MTLGAITGSKAVVLDRWRHTGRLQPLRVGGKAVQPGGRKRTQNGGIALQYGNAASGRALAAGCHRKRGNGMTSCKCNQCKKCPNDAKRQVMCVWCWKGLCYTRKVVA